MSIGARRLNLTKIHMYVWIESMLLIKVGNDIEGLEDCHACITQTMRWIFYSVFENLFSKNKKWSLCMFSPT